MQLENLTLCIRFRRM